MLGGGSIGGGVEAVKKVPLSLEELLAKKKAEEEALSKVCWGRIYWGWGGGS